MNMHFQQLLVVYPLKYLLAAKYVAFYPMQRVYSMVHSALQKLVLVKPPVHCTLYSTNQVTQANPESLCQCYKLIFLRNVYLIRLTISRQDWNYVRTGHALGIEVQDLCIFTESAA